jgi:hypothetical protein
MAQYVLKVLINIEAGDDVGARQRAATIVQEAFAKIPEVRDIVLHSPRDYKSIHLNPDGTFHEKWNKG